MVFPVPSNFLKNIRLIFNKKSTNSNSPHVTYKSIGGTHITNVINVKKDDEPAMAIKETTRLENIPRPLPKIQPKQTAIYVPMEGELKRIPTQEELDLVQMVRKNKPYNSITDVGIVLNEDGTIDKLQWNES